MGRVNDAKVLRTRSRTRNERGLRILTIENDYSKAESGEVIVITWNLGVLNIPP